MLNPNQHKISKHCMHIGNSHSNIKNKGRRRHPLLIALVSEPDTATDESNRLYFRQRPYCVEYTRSHPNSEVKLRKARSVLGWGTAWEALRVPLTFSFHEVTQMYNNNKPAAP